MKLEQYISIHNELNKIEKYIEAYMPTEQRNDVTDQIIREVANSKGKRFRPILVLLCGQCGPLYDQVTERLYKAGALVEMVHMASLIHDDIVDDSPLRRGVPTVQHKYGKDVAVYSGDLILGRVLRILFQESMFLEGIFLGQTIEDMCRGEINQMHCYYQADTSVEEYMKNIYGKTVSLFQTACKIGATESGCRADEVQALCDYGEHLGYLFQIRDDLLDFISTSKDEGKPTHVDFEEGILTLPVLFALEDMNYAEQIKHLIRLAHQGLLTEKDIQTLQDIVNESGALQRAVDELSLHIQLAQHALNQLSNKKAIMPLKKILDLLKI